VSGAAGLAAGLLVAVLVARARLSSPPPALVRTNVAGRAVPAVLGDGVAAGSITGVVLVAAWADALGFRTATSLALAIALMWAAGRFDDLRGDERPRGFKGHLAAARAGALTGGLVKVAAGVAAGVSGGIILAGGIDLVFVVEVGLLAALTANLVNLLDRAPGRALKAWFAVSLPLFIFGPVAWAGAAAGMLGAALAVLPADLREKGMLGDAGANALGVALGLGLAVSLNEPARIGAIVALLALNLASERWSFSKAIESVPLLHALDRLGRK
jgi:hypothetical protein